MQKWHINSAEPNALEYDVAGDTTDITTPFRSSEHDPVLIGVNFAGIRNAVSSRPANRLFAYPGPLAFSLASVPASAGALTLNFALPKGPRMLSLHGSPALLEGHLNNYKAHFAPDIYVLTVRGKSFSQIQRVIKE